MVNIEQLVKLIISREDDLHSGSKSITVALGEMDRCEKIMLFSGVKIKSLIAAIRVVYNQDTNAFSNLSYKLKVAEADSCMYNAGETLFKSLGYIDGAGNKRSKLAEAEMVALRKATEWSEHLTLMIIILIYTLIPIDDDETVLATTMEYLYTYYRYIDRLGVPEIDYRESVYLSEYITQSMKVMGVE